VDSEKKGNKIGVLIPGGGKVDNTKCHNQKKSLLTGKKMLKKYGYIGGE
jgi:hypothetical protein